MSENPELTPIENYHLELTDLGVDVDIPTLLHLEEMGITDDGFKLIKGFFEKESPKVSNPEAFVKALADRGPIIKTSSENSGVRKYGLYPSAMDGWYHYIPDVDSSTIIDKSPDEYSHFPFALTIPDGKTLPECNDAVTITKRCANVILENISEFGNATAYDTHGAAPEYFYYHRFLVFQNNTKENSNDYSMGVVVDPVLKKIVPMNQGYYHTLGYPHFEINETYWKCMTDPGISLPYTFINSEEKPRELEANQIIQDIGISKNQVLVDGQMQNVAFFCTFQYDASKKSFVPILYGSSKDKKNIFEFRYLHKRVIESNHGNATDQPSLPMYSAAERLFQQEITRIIFHLASVGGEKSIERPDSEHFWTASLIFSEDEWGESTTYFSEETNIVPADNELIVPIYKPKGIQFDTYSQIEEPPYDPNDN